MLCYEIVKPAEEIFVTDNIRMICDECIASPRSDPSPKRKLPNAVGNLMQSTIDVLSPTLSLSKAAPVLSTPSKNNNGKQLQTVVEALVHKIETQTNTISGLKTSIETMSGKLNQQTGLIGKSLDATKNLIEAKAKPTYANIVSRQTGQGRSSMNETPKSTKTSNPNQRNLTPALPSMSGTSTKVFGKPPSPRQPNQQRKPRGGRKIAEKAVWVSNMHRDISENEILAYIKDDLKIKDDQLAVRKLVKKGIDISLYNFVSFCVECSANSFDALMEVSNWPSYSKIREFELDTNPPIVDSLVRRSPSKNAQETSNVNSP